MRVGAYLLRKLRRRQRRQWGALYVSQRPWPALTFRNVAYGSVETCCGVTESNSDVIVTVYWSCVSQGFELRLFGWPTVIIRNSVSKWATRTSHHHACLRLSVCTRACLCVWSFMRGEIGRLCRFYCVIEHSHKYDVVIYWSHYHLNK